jgi:hypothetical protein
MMGFADTCKEVNSNPNVDGEDSQTNDDAEEVMVEQDPEGM